MVALPQAHPGRSDDRHIVRRGVAACGTGTHRHLRPRLRHSLRSLRPRGSRQDPGDDRRRGLDGPLRGAAAGAGVAIRQGHQPRPPVVRARGDREARGRCRLRHRPRRSPLPRLRGRHRQGARRPARFGRAAGLRPAHHHLRRRGARRRRLPASRSSSRSATTIPTAATTRSSRAATTSPPPARPSGSWSAPISSPPTSMRPMPPAATTPPATRRSPARSSSSSTTCCGRSATRTPAARTGWPAARRRWPG